MAGRAETLIAGAVRLVVSAVFVYAGIGKALDPAGFATAVSHYRLVPEVIAAVVAAYLPWLEVVCGLGLWWRRTRLGAANLLLLLSLLFAAVIASALVRHLDIACGCFGSTSAGRSLLGFDLARSLVLALAAAYLLRVELSSPDWGAPAP